MKVAMLAGGAGMRLAEETSIKPKPMVEISDRPILWHIMKYYANFGLTDFSVALGYKGEVTKTLLPRLPDSCGQHEPRSLQRAD